MGHWSRKSMTLGTLLHSYRNQIIASFFLAAFVVIVFEVQFFFDISNLQNTIHKVFETYESTQTETLRSALMEDVETLKRTAFFFLLAMVLLGLGVVVNLVFVLTISLRAIMYGIQEFAAGNKTHHISLRRKNEFSTIAQFLNTTIDAVTSRTEELEKLQANLEQVVKERTHELESKIKELETFQRLTVGRELKMIELKNELARLKGEDSEVQS